MSVKLLWKALGSNHWMLVVQWRMQLSLSGLLPWMIGPTDHTQKHIGNFVRVCLVASESYHLLSSQRANQISILPGQIKSFNYIWSIGSSSISLPQPSPTEEFITSTSSKASTAVSNWRVYHINIVQSILRQLQLKSLSLQNHPKQITLLPSNVTSPPSYQVLSKEYHRIQLLKRITPSCSPEWLLNFVLSETTLNLHNSGRE